MAIAGHGSIELSAAGGGITVQRAVQAATGSVALEATGAIATSGLGTVRTAAASRLDIASSGADISLGADVSSAGGLVNLSAAGAVAMADGTVTGSVHASNSGAVVVAAGGNVTLSTVRAGGAITISSTRGAITGNLDAGGLNADADGIHLDGDTAVVTLSAANGAGTAAAHLLTRIADLAAQISSGGGLFVQEQTSLRVAGGSGYAIDVAGGAVGIATANGELRVLDGIRTTGDGGHIRLLTGEAAEGTSSDASLVVLGDVVSRKGSITLRSADDIVQGDASSTGVGIAAQAAGQTLDLQADGAVTMEALSTLGTVHGNVRVVASGGSATIGAITAGSGRVSIVAAGAIADAQDDDGAARATVNVTAAQLRLEGATGVGSADRVLETAVDLMAARASAAGADLFLAELDAATIGTVAPVGANRIGADGSVTVVTDLAALSGLTAGAGGVAALGIGADLVIDQPFAMPGGGHLLLQARGTVDVNAQVSTVTGSITLLAGGELRFGAAGALVTVDGTIDVESTTGGVTMAHGALLQTSGGNVRVKAAGDLTVGLVDARDGTATQANWGSVSLLSSAGAIRDNANETAVDVYAAELRLQAAGGIASAADQLETEARVLSAQAGAGGLFVADASALAIGATGDVTVDRIGGDGLVLSSRTDGAQAGVASGAAVVVTTADGALSITQAIAAQGHVLLSAGGAAGDLSLAADVGSATGSISLAAARDLSLAAEASTGAAGRTLDLLAGGNLSLAGGRLATVDGSISLVATGAVTLGQIDAGTAGVRVRGATVLDGNATGNDIVAARVQLEATAAGGAIGAAGDAIEIAAGELAAAAGTGGLFLSAAGSVTVQSVQVSVDRVTELAALSTLTATARQGLSSGAALILVLDAGDLVLATGTGAVDAGGRALLQATAGTVTANAGISAGGSISVVGTAVTQAAAGDIATAAGTLDVRATAGNIRMEAGATATAASGNIRYAASGQLTLGQLDARGGATQGDWGHVSLLAGGAIASAMDDTGIDVYANELRLQAGGAIGAAGDALATEAARLSAQAGAGFFLQDASSLTVGATAAIGVDGVAASGAVTTISDGAQEDLRVLAGSTVLTAATGNLVIEAGTDDAAALVAGGSLRLEALAGSVALRGEIGAAGHLSVLAATGLALDGVGVSSTAGTIELATTAGDLLMAAGAAVRTDGQGLRVQAGGSVTLGTLDARTAADRAGATLDGQAGWGSVSITAGAAIATLDAATALHASGLRLNAGGTIGSALLPLAIEAAVLTALAGGDLHIDEATGLRIDGLGDLAVQRPNRDGNGATAVTDPAQAGLASGGLLVLRTGTGSLTVAQGSDVSAGGDILLSAGGTGSDLTLDAAIGSTGGAIGLAATGDVSQSGSISTAGQAIDLQAGGDWTMGGAATVASAGGAIAIAASGTVTVTTVDAGSGAIAITAHELLDADLPTDTAADLSGSALQLVLSGDGGSRTNALETDVGTLTVDGGDVFVANAGDLLLAGADTGTLVVQAGGNLTVDTAVSSSGNVLLGASGSIRVDAGVQANGSLTLAAGGNLDLTATGTLQASTGDIVATAGGALTMDEQSSASAGGNLQLAASGDATITGLTAAAVIVTSSAGAILDAGDLRLDIDAGVALLQAQGDVGGATQASALELSVATLAAQSAQGDVALDEADGFTAGSVSITVQAVGSGGTAAAGDAATGLGLQSAGGGSIDLVSGGNLVLASSSTQAAIGSSGSVTLAVTGTIADGADAYTDIAAGQLQVSATGAVGAAGAAIETAADSLTAQAGGAIYLAERDALTVGGIVSTAAGNLILTAGGDLGVTGAASASSGNLLLQSTGGSLSLQSTVQAGGGGHLSVLAQQGVSIGAAGALTSAGSVQVDGGSGSVTMAAGSRIDAQQDVSVQAGGDITVAGVSTPGTASFIATGSITDAGEAGTNIQAAAVQLVAGGSVGTDAAPLQLDTAALAASGGAGGLWLLEADDVTVGDVQASVQGVQADGATQAAPTAPTSDLVTTGGGSIELATLDGTITLTAGSHAGSGAVSAAGGGSITLAAGGTGSVRVQADVSSGGGDIAIDAGDSVLFDNGASIVTQGSGAISVDAAGGDVIMDTGSVLASGTGTIAVEAGGDIAPGTLQTDGIATLDAQGAVLITDNSGSSGDDIDIRADDVRITGPLESPGATLTITPVTNVPVVIGGTAPGTPALHLSPAELALIRDGFAEIVIGGALAGQVVALEGGTTPVVFQDPVTLVASNGSIAIEGQVQGDSLRIQDSATGTTLTGVQLALQGGLQVEDSLVLSGANRLASNLGGAGGNLVLLQAIAGDADATPDTLALDANGGNVQLAAVSNLDGLSITDAVNVTFGGAVTLDGDLVIEATGLVTFAGPLTLTNGAQLRIVGGGQVVFQGAVDAGSGDVTIEAATLSLAGGADSFTGSGDLVVRSSAGAIVIGDGAAAAGALRLSSATLQALDGFAAVQIGTPGAGQVTLSGTAHFGVLAAPVQVAGSTLTVAAGAAVQLGGGSFDLQGSGAVSIAGSIAAQAPTTITVSSTGADVQMAAGARIASEGGDVSIAGASGLALATVDARGAGGAAGAVTVDAGAGTLTDANADDAADVFAQSVTVRGSGPAQGSGGNVIEVAAGLVFIDAAGGLVLRESGEDGRTHYNVLRDRQLYEQAVSVGPSMRVTSDPQTLLLGPQGASLQQSLLEMALGRAAGGGDERGGLRCVRRLRRIGAPEHAGAGLPVVAREQRRRAGHHAVPGRRRGRGRAGLGGQLRPVRIAGAGLGAGCAGQPAAGRRQRAGAGVRLLGRDAGAVTGTRMRR